MPAWGWCQGLGFGRHRAPAAPGSGQAWPQRSLDGTDTQARRPPKRLSLQNLKPHSAHLGSSCLVHWKLGSVSLSSLKKKKGLSPKRGDRLENTLNWKQSLQISGCEKIQAFLWSEMCFKLIWISPGISRPLGTGAEIQTWALGQLFLLVHSTNEA